MKRRYVLVILIFAAVAASAQTNLTPIDKSPMDMSYYPVDYPILKIQNKAKEPLIARVIYGRPQKNGRVVFGDLVPYGSVWRLGANEATEIEFFQDVKIGNKKISKGRYTLYALPDTSKWTIIINTETNTWGAFGYDAKKDLARIDVPVKKQDEPVEIFTMIFEKDKKNSANLLMSWDDILVKLPINW